MKDDFPELWLPTKKTNGNDVPRSEFLASGPRRLEFSGMTEECSDEHCDNIVCWMDADGLPSLVLCSLLPFPLLLLEASLSSEFNSGEGEGFFDQFHVVLVR